MKIFDEKVPILESTEFNLDYNDRLNLFCGSSYIKYFIKKDGIIYHKRSHHEDHLLNEIMGELIAEYFNIDSVRSVLYKTNDPRYRYSTLTKLFTTSDKKYGYIDTIFTNYKEEDKLFNLDNLDKVYENYHIKDIDKNSKEILLLKLKKMIIIDYIIFNIDRIETNFMFSIDGNKVKLEPLYDFEFSFKLVNENYNVFDFDLNDSKVISYFRNDDCFQELLYKAMDLKMRNIYKKLEEKYPIKLDYVDVLKYSNCVLNRQKEISKHKLIR